MGMSEAHALQTVRHSFSMQCTIGHAAQPNDCQSTASSSADHANTGKPVCASTASNRKQLYKCATGPDGHISGATRLTCSAGRAQAMLSRPEQPPTSSTLSASSPPSSGTPSWPKPTCVRSTQRCSAAGVSARGHQQQQDSTLKGAHALVLRRTGLETQQFRCPALTLSRVLLTHFAEG
jgi:hypothetical protein